MPNTGQVYVVRPDGSDLKQVTAGDWSNVQPSFSNDSKRIYTYRHVESEAFDTDSSRWWSSCPEPTRVKQA